VAAPVPRESETLARDSRGVERPPTTRERLEQQFRSGEGVAEASGPEARPGEDATCAVSRPPTLRERLAHGFHAKTEAAQPKNPPGETAAAAERVDGPLADRALPSVGASGGAALPHALRHRMEQAFDTDFSDVRIHVGGAAGAIGARAYTRGNDIHLSPRHYQAGSREGDELVGHELTHVVQQRQGRVAATAQAKGAGATVNQDHALEAEADQLGARAARGERVTSGARRPFGVRRDPSGGPSRARRGWNGPAVRAAAPSAVVQMNGGFATLAEAVDGLNEASKKHILVEKHAWGLVISGHQHVPNEKKETAIPEGSWEAVRAIMLQVVAGGTEEVYKGQTKKKVMKVGEQTVEVTFIKFQDNTYRVSDAWVKTK